MHLHVWVVCLDRQTTDSPVAPSDSGSKRNAGASAAIAVVIGWRTSSRLRFRLHALSKFPIPSTTTLTSPHLSNNNRSQPRLYLSQSQPTHSTINNPNHASLVKMSAQNETTNTAGEATTTVDKGKGKATEPATDDVSMGEDEDSSEEESGAEEPVSEAH